jgi:hypothetical protein
LTASSGNPALKIAIRQGAFRRHQARSSTVFDGFELKYRLFLCWCSGGDSRKRPPPAFKNLIMASQQDPKQVLQVGERKHRYNTRLLQHQSDALRRRAGKPGTTRIVRFASSGPLDGAAASQTAHQTPTPQGHHRDY